MNGRDDVGRAGAKDASQVEAWTAVVEQGGDVGPDELGSAMAAARAARRAGDDVAAEMAWRRALAVAPGGPVALAVRAALGWQLHLGGHAGEADTELEQAIAGAEEAGLEYTLARARHQRGVFLFHRGRVDEAGVEFRAAIELDRRAGRAVASSLSGLADVLAERGDVLGSRRAYEEAGRLARGAGDDVFDRTVAVRLAGAVAFDDVDAAWALAEQGVGPYPPTSYWSALAPSIAGFIALARGDARAAADLADRAFAELRRGFPDLVAGDVLLLRALCESGDGRGPATGRSAIEALQIWRRIGNPVWLARAEALLAAQDRGPEGRAALELARRRLGGLGVSKLAFGPGGGALLALLPETEAVEVRCLGAFAVVRDGRPVAPAAWQSRKARDLLKLLIAGRGRAVPREVLMEALWPEDDPEPQANRLSVALATVRSILDPGRAYPPTHFVTSDGNRYALDLGHLPVDVERFLAQVAAARSAMRSGASEADRREALEAAEVSYSGDAFEDEPYADWAIPLREEARAAYAETARALAALAADRGDADVAIRYELRLLDRDPFDEAAHLALVRTLIGSLRYGEARRAHGIYEARMRELGVTPAAFPVEPFRP